MSPRVKATLLSYMQVAVRIVTTLAFTPILVRSLGLEGYGLFSIVGAFAAYFYMIDFGLNDGLIRFFVKHERMCDERRRFLHEMLGLYAALSLLVVVMTGAAYRLTPVMFDTHLSADQIDLVQCMVVVVGAGAAVMVAFNPLGALLSAMERFVFLRTLEIFTTIASSLLIVAALYKGFGALMVVTVMSGALVLQVVVRAVYVITVPKIGLGWAWPSWFRFRPVAAYAAPIFVSIMVEQIYWKLDNLIIGVFLGAAPVAVYAIGTTFNKFLMSFGTAISRIMTPEIIRQASHGGDLKAMNDLLIKVSRLQALLLLLVISGLSIFGARFIELWLGPQYHQAYAVMLIVLVPYTLELIGNSRNILLQVRGLYWHRSLLIFFIAALNIPFTIFLLQVWGVEGAAVSTGIGILAGYVVVVILLQWRLALDMRYHFRELGRGIAMTLVICLSIGLVLNIYLPDGWLGFLVCVTIYTGVYGLLMLKFGMNAYERRLLNQLVGQLLPGRRAPA